MSRQMGKGAFTTGLFLNGIALGLLITIVSGCPSASESSYNDLSFMARLYNPAIAQQSSSEGSLDEPGADGGNEAEVPDAGQAPEQPQQPSDDGGDAGDKTSPLPDDDIAAENSSSGGSDSGVTSYGAARVNHLYGWSRSLCVKAGGSLHINLVHPNDSSQGVACSVGVPLHGKLQRFGGKPFVTYIPNPGFKGSDYFYFQLYDSKRSGNTGQIWLDVK